MTMNSTQIIDKQQQDQVWHWLQQQPQANLWQSQDWAQFRTNLGNETRLYATANNNNITAAAVVVISTTTGGLSTWELPRGPLWTNEGSCIQLLEAIKTDACTDRCLALYASPFTPLPVALTGYRESNRFVQPQATQMLDLTEPEEEILKQMKPKGRYNIRVAEKKKVQITHSNDAEAFAALHATTGSRNAFNTPQAQTYKHFLQMPGSFLLLAYIPELTTPIAGVIGIIYKGTGIYYYGASVNEYRNTMAPYALQWAAIQHCKAAGCTSYDFFGIAPTNSANHPWAGVTSFKQKFGGTYTEYPPEQVALLKPVLHMLLSFKRKIW